MTIKAAVRGVVNFANARIEDVNWWRRTNILIKAMAEEEDAKALKAAYAYQLALVGNGLLVPESFKDAQTKSKELFNEYVNMIQPWSAKTLGQVRANEIDNMLATYKRLIGDPNNPEFRKFQREQVEKFERRAEEASKRRESDDERVDRLIRERELRKRLPRK